MRKFAAKELTGQEEDRAQLLGWLMVQGSMFGECDLVTQSPVSYTHLTLPTKLEV